jgi:hypothetical protein
MLPLINPGEQVAVRLTDPHRLKRGDLFAFETGENITVHRFVNKKFDGLWWFCEVGDSAADWGWVQEGRVLGMVLSVRGPDRFLDMESRPWVWINSIFGFAISLSVALCENLGRSGSRPSWQQGARVLHRAVKKLLRKTIHEVTRRSM